MNTAQESIELSAFRVYSKTSKEKVSNFSKSFINFFIKRIPESSSFVSLWKTQKPRDVKFLKNDY
jgi:hypothetical protein